MFIYMINRVDSNMLFIQIISDSRRIADSPEKKKKSRRILDDDTTEGSNDEKESSPNKK